MIKFYNEKTGNPYIDNQVRMINKVIFLTAKHGFRVETPRGRKRKKYITSVELPKYMNLLHLMVQDQSRKLNG